MSHDVVEKGAGGMWFHLLHDRALVGGRDPMLLTSPPASAIAAARRSPLAPSMLLTSPPAITDVPAAFASLASTRAAGRVAAPATYERLMMACVESGRGLAAYRLYEEAAADGLRWRQLSRRARSVLQPRLPPEAEAVGHRRSPLASPRRLLRAGRRQRELCCDELPELWVSPSASVATFDCRPGSGRDAALAAAWEAVAAREAPVLMRGVGEAWPALEAWDLRLLKRAMRRAMVRVSPSSAVTFCRESHPDVRSGQLEPPSRTVVMGVRELVDRLHTDRGGRAPLLYGETERVYLQALAPYSMMRLVDFSFLPTDAGAAAQGAVLGRLWVSAPGTLSPLHYDAQDSYLCQVRGVKRLLLWPAAELDALRPYPDDHPMARRLQVDVVGSPPTAEAWRGSAAERAAVEAPLEARLGPGDVLYFPENWAHHTEALPPEDDGRHGAAAAAAAAAEPSFSLGFRTDGSYLL